MLPVRFEMQARGRVRRPSRHTPRSTTLRPLRDLSGHEQPIPARGVILTDILASAWVWRPGERVRVVTLEGDRRVLEIPVAGLVSEPMGMAGHMSLRELHRLLAEPETINMVLLAVDPRAEQAVQQRVDALPMVASAGNVKRLLQKFAEQSGKSMDVFALVIALFAGAITIGVVYNNARITLNTRQRDLASMRILGYTQSEIGAVLQGELTVQVALALPLGLWLGRKMLDGMMSDVDPEAFRMPAVINSATDGTGTDLAPCSTRDPPREAPLHRGRHRPGVARAARAAQGAARAGAAGPREAVRGAAAQRGAAGPGGAVRRLRRQRGGPGGAALARHAQRGGGEPPAAVQPRPAYARPRPRPHSLSR
jgi:hypothetical protein